MGPASRIVLAAFACACTTLVCGCAAGGDAGGQHRLRVAATTTQIADFARNVGGDRVRVTSLVGPNVDPHDYEPTPGDVADVSRADLVLEHGIGLDAWLDGVISNAGGRARRVLVTAGIPLLAGDAADPSGDPHVWLDPRNAVAMVRNIADAFAAADPAGAAAYRANARRYIRSVDALDRALRADIATVPAARRRIVTDHDALGYFARRYGVTVVGTVIPSLSTAAEPSAGDLARLAEVIRREGVGVVFAERTVDPRLERAIADETGASVGTLAGDSLGPSGTPTGTYLGMMRYDMDAIVAGTRG